MVIVENTTKKYGSQRAVDNISFTAKSGEVLGFLGPNGAGKTTTMKMITCYIPATEGSIHVCGYDVRTESMQVQRKIGYLPEHNPLYKDMYVKEYLRFIAGLHGIRNKGERVGEMIARTGLEKEQHKKIGALSKGYRQRVGLAQAMIHNPEVLILDEPTSGLDPNQLAEIRKLIQHLGREKTVIFSTHIMQEVQAICDRVLIINNGKIVADDPIAELKHRISSESVVTTEFQEILQANELKKITGVKRVEQITTHKWRLFGSAETDLRPNVFRFASEKGYTLVEIHQEVISVEDIFQQLTTK